MLLVIIFLVAKLCLFDVAMSFGKKALFQLYHLSAIFINTLPAIFINTFPAALLFTIVVIIRSIFLLYWKNSFPRETSKLNVDIKQIKCCNGS